MNLSIISFTKKGRELSERIAENLDRDDPEGTVCRIKVSLFSGQKNCEDKVSGHFILPLETSVGEWAGKQMQEKNAMLFIGACGIAVRAIAPHLTDKLHDGPVLVMDESGKYVIPILSGHVGGANELARYIGEKTGAEPVITTATDINGKFAVDLFARENGLSIEKKEGIAAVSSKVLAGEKVGISIEPEFERILFRPRISLQEKDWPKEVYIEPYPPKKYVDIVVTSQEEIFDAAIVLKPKEYVIGFGCKRGKTAEEIEKFLIWRLRDADVSISQILALASVSQKRNEQGIIVWCQREKIPFLTYTAEELREVKGDFKSSSFVEDKIGVDNVCERAALMACGEHGQMICEKYAKDGMTFALAKKYKGHEEGRLKQTEKGKIYGE